MPRKKLFTVGEPQNVLVKSIIEKFNDEEGKESAKLVSDDVDSFMLEFKNDELVDKFGKFMADATGKKVVTEPLVNAFGTSTLARIFFEQPTANEAIERLKEYDEGTTPKGVDVCEGCGSKHAS